VKSRPASLAPRLLASIALGAVALLGTTGCTFITEQATEIPYSASDGVNVGGDSGPVQVRNAMIVATEDGTTGNLAAGLVNDTADDETVTISLEGHEPFTVDVPAGERVSLGADEDPLRIDGLNVDPGATVKVLFQSGDVTGASAAVPVLDGTLPYYADLVPEPEIVPLSETPAS
jgi:hypothetical protein